jgi:Ni/Co efflux regulator RcnB
MKRLLSVVSVLALVLPAAAGAQQSNTNQTSGRHRPNRPTQPVTIQPVPKPQPSRPGHRPRPPVTIQPIKPGRPHRPGYRPPHVRPIHRPPFHYPHGYHYRRWHIGWVLPHIFLSNHYYFNDWATLGFGPPPPGYVWVRYGPDLLLVNRHTGRIRDVVYNVFY